MSTLKMVLHVEKTAKANIQKKLPKSQKFTKKISVEEFHYSQTIFLRLTVILFHSNLDEKITSKKNKQRVKSNEQRAKSNEQPAKSNEQPAKSNEQPAKTNNQQATSKKFSLAIRNLVPHFLV